jgi:hypothetical protein
MQSFAGAIVVLAGAVAFGAGVLASALRGNTSDAIAYNAMAAGGFLILFGIVVLLLGCLKENKPKT